MQISKKNLLRIITYSPSIFLFSLLIVKACFTNMNYVDALFLFLGGCVTFLIGFKKRAVKSLIDFYGISYDETSWFLLRIFFICLLIYCYPNVYDFPLTNPLSFFYFFPNLGNVLVSSQLQFYVHIIFNLLLIFFFFNKKTKTIIPAITVIYIVNSILSMSYGKLGNDAILPAQLLLVLSAFFFASKNTKKEIGYLFFLLYAVLSLYYFLPFFSKIYMQPTHLWVNGNSLRLWILQKIYDKYGYSGILEENMLQSLLVRFPFLTLVNSGIALAIEGSGSLLLFFRNHFLKLFLLINLLALHLMIWVAMDIQFYPNIILLVGFIFLEITILLKRYVVKQS